MAKSLTIGLILFNEVEILPTLIKDLQQESLTLLTEIEWIFVINTGDIFTQNKIVKIIQTLLKKYIVQLNTHNNIALARNLILEHSHCDFIYYTDPDIKIQPGSLKTMYETLLHSEDQFISGVTGPHTLESKKNININKMFCLFRYLSSYLKQENQLFQSTQHAKITHAPTCHLMIKKDYIKKINGFDPDFFDVAEDLDLSLRLNSETEFKYLFIPEARAQHFFEKDLKIWLLKMFRYGYGQTLILKKHQFKRIMIHKLSVPALTIAAVLAVLKYPLISLLTLILVFIFARFIVYTILSVYFYAAGQIFGLFLRTKRARNAKEIPPNKDLNSLFEV